MFFFFFFFFFFKRRAEYKISAVLVGWKVVKENSLRLRQNKEILKKKKKKILLGFELNLGVNPFELVIVSL